LLDWEDRLGTVEASKLLDLIAVKGDSLQDLSELERVSFVMLGGKVIRPRWIKIPRLRRPQLPSSKSLLSNTGLTKIKVKRGPSSFLLPRLSRIGGIYSSLYYVLRSPSTDSAKRRLE
jgi:hypothetical protein